MTTVSIVRVAPRGNNSTTTIIIFILVTHVFILVQTLRRRTAETYQDGSNNPSYGQSEDY